jgi:REP element-mobilizing transposase RayT
MARSPREFQPESIYHVYSRGSNQQAIFAFDSDRADFLDCVTRVIRVHELTCFAYCLMPNHYHLLIETSQPSLSDAMKALNGRYALRFNRRYGRSAHLFKNRFGAVLQETEEQFRWTLRYIVCNPVTSGLCAKPEEWPWSSYGACAGIRRPAPFLDVERLLAFFADTPGTAMSRYRQFVNDALTRASV